MTDIFIDGKEGTTGLQIFDRLAKRADVRVITLPEELLVTAVADDGEVMAVQHRDYPIYGVQFHPESIMTPDGRQMLKNFIE